MKEVEKFIECNANNVQSIIDGIIQKRVEQNEGFEGMYSECITAIINESFTTSDGNVIQLPEDFLKEAQRVVVNKGLMNFLDKNHYTLSKEIVNLILTQEVEHYTI